MKQTTTQTETTFAVTETESSAIMYIGKNTPAWPVLVWAITAGSLFATAIYLIG